MTETKQMAFREAINLAMAEEMRKDDMVFLMGEDVGIYGGDFGTSVGLIERRRLQGALLGLLLQVCVLLWM